MSEPKPAAEFVRAILRETGTSRERGAYAGALDAILPEAQRAHCQVVGCRGGRLVVEVDSAPLLAELRGFRRDELRLRINQLLPDRPIAQLTLRLGGTGHV
jgi:hypothetical protein